VTRHVTKSGKASGGFGNGGLASEFGWPVSRIVAINIPDFMCKKNKKLTLWPFATELRTCLSKLGYAA
jgi:hypothetical protein